jgi:hypothetical protein
MAVVDNAFETKGTHLFFADPTSSDPIVRKLTCPTGITGINGGTRDRIDTTCLDEIGAFRTYVGGFADPSEISVPFVLYDGDESHKSLFDLQDSGQVIGWYVGLSDSPAVPTVDTEGSLVSPPLRTGISFRGYVSNLTLDAAVNEVVRGTLTIQRVGGSTVHWAS